MARILRVTAYRLLLVVTRGLFRTSPGLLSALVLACGVLCTLPAQGQSLSSTYLLQVSLTGGSCATLMNPLFTSAVLYCGRGTVNSSSEPACASISATTVTFAGAGYAVPGTSSPTVYESNIGPIGGYLQPIIWTGSGSTVTFWVTATTSISSVSVALTCY